MAAPLDHPSDIPDKLYFRIGEVSRIAGVPTSVLRFWENEFPRIKPRRTDAGQRLYRKSDVALILTVKHLLYEKKFTIKGARQYLSRQRRDETAPAPPRSDLLREIRKGLQEIQDLLK